MATLAELIEREPGNMVARIQLARMHSFDDKLDDLILEHEAILADARGGPFEPQALLRIARVYGPRRKRAEATRYYEELIEKEPRMAGVAYSEMGVGAFVDGDLEKARGLYEKALAEHETEGLAGALHVFGEKLRRFGGGMNPSLNFLFQDRIWLAVVCSKAGDLEAARSHLQDAVDMLREPELAVERSRLGKHAVGVVERYFPELSGEPLINELAA